MIIYFYFIFYFLFKLNLFFIASVKTGVNVNESMNALINNLIVERKYSGPRSYGGGYEVV